jgi:CRISPR-associated protein Csx10
MLPADDAERLRDAVNRNGSGARIGRSRKDDYGAVDIVATPGGAAPVRRAVVGGTLMVYLASDLLLADAAGTALTTPADVCQAVATALKKAQPDAVFELAVPAETGDDVPPSTMTAARRRESWQTRWGLPRPSLVGMAAGSVLRLTVTGAAPSDEALAAVERDGLGLRRAEGYGDIRLSPSWLAAPSVGVTRRAAAAPTVASPEVGADVKASAEVKRHWAPIERALWLAEIEQAAVAAAHDPATRRMYIPAGRTASQLGTLRAVIGGGDAGSRLRAWSARTCAEHTAIKDLSNGDTRWSKWEKQFRALWTLGRSPGQVFDALGMNQPGERPPQDLATVALATFVRALVRAESRVSGADSMKEQR